MAEPDAVAVAAAVAAAAVESLWWLRRLRGGAGWGSSQGSLRSLPNDGRFSFEKFNYKLSEALLER